MAGGAGGAVSNGFQILDLAFNPFIYIAVIGIPIAIIGVFHDQINIGDQCVVFV